MSGEQLHTDDLFTDPAFILSVLEIGRNLPHPTDFSTIGFDVTSYRLRRGLLEQLSLMTPVLSADYRNFINEAEEQLYPQAWEYFRYVR